MSLLTIVQTVCKRAGVTPPSIVIGNSDPQIIQMLALLEALGQELSNGEYVWRFQRNRYQWNSTGALIQTPTPLNDDSFGGIINDTFWDITDQTPIAGPLSPADWQQLRTTTLTSVGPSYFYYFNARDLEIYPFVPVGHQMSFLYWTYNWIEAVGSPNNPSQGLRVFSNDAERTFFPEATMIVGLQAWWARQKGLPYAELMASFNNMIETAKMKETPKVKLDMAGGRREPRPGIFVPSGNWPL